MRTRADAVAVYVGTYQAEGEESLFRLRFDPSTGALGLRTAVGRTAYPAFLAVHPTGRYLYAVSEVNEGAGGAVCAFAIPPGDDGELRPLGCREAFGRSTCHVRVDATGRWVAVANYAGPTVALFPVRADGSLGEASVVLRHEGSGAHPRQAGPHPHAAQIDPSNRFIYVPDLGTDRIVVYRLDPDAGGLAAHDPAWVRTPSGAGPRHLDFHPTLPYAYAVNELDSTVAAYAWDRERGVLVERQVVAALPEGFEGTSTAADIHVHPSGRFLYASNRGHDSLVGYRIDAGSGCLTRIGHTSTRGRTPRNFAVDPTGAFVVAANQDSDTIAVFAVDPDRGTLSPVGPLMPLPKPACVLFAPALAGGGNEAVR